MMAAKALRYASLIILLGCATVASSAGLGGRGAGRPYENEM